MFLTVAGCNYIRAARTSCCYLCCNACSNHYRIFQWKLLSNVWFSQCLPACRVFLGLCVKLQTCRVITSVWENLQGKQEARTAVSFPFWMFCAQSQPVFCKLLLCSPAAVWMESCNSLTTDWFTGKWKRGLHISYSFTRSFFLVAFVLSDKEEERCNDPRITSVEQSVQRLWGKSETWDCCSQVLHRRNEGAEKLWLEWY